MRTANSQLARLAGVEIFTVDGAPFTWADAVLSAFVGGEWARVEQSTRDGLAAQKRLTASGAEVSHEEAVEAARRFRYDRQLLAGEELDAWLSRWGISVAEWRDHLRRDLLLGRPAAVTAAVDVPASEIDAVVGVDAICSGALEQAARTLAEHAALAGPAAGGDGTDRSSAAEPLAGLLGIPVEQCVARLAVVSVIADGVEAARDRIAAEPAIERELEEHGLDWLHLDLDVIDFPTRDAACEAVLCVRNDGLELAEVGAAAGRSPARLSVTLADTPDWLAPHLLGVEAGSLAGPIARDGGFSVVSVAARREPSANDADSRARAVEALVERASARQVGSKVVWHDRL